MSQELHTAKLLSPHVLVGYWGQNPRWDVVGSTPTAIHTASCRTPPPEPDGQLVTASGSHGISYVSLVDKGCMPDQRDVTHRILRDGSSDGTGRKQGVAFG